MRFILADNDKEVTDHDKNEAQAYDLAEYLDGNVFFSFH